MTSTLDRPPSPPHPPRRRRRRRLLLAAVVTVLLLAAAGAGIWWFFRGDAPDAVSLQAATEQVTDTKATTAAVDAAAVADTAAATDDTTIAGAWTVDTSVGEFSFEDSTGTFVGFRVDEELSGLGSTTAVGRTPDVTGTVTIEGTTVTAATIEADMTSITTNDSRRNDEVQSALETSTYPTATFILTSPIELGDAAASGQAVTVEATGELTINGVTKTVTIPLQAQLVDGTVVLIGSTEIRFSDYGVSVPEAPIVLSASDTGTLELQLFLQR
jgi:polyisoprenoid-binding protein YceI